MFKSLNSVLTTFDAIIFDFDGVILNTELYHFKAWERALAKQDIVFTWSDYEDCKSRGKAFVIKKVETEHEISFDDETIKKLMLDKDQYFKEFSMSLSEKDYIPGSLNYIKALFDSGMPLGVASSGVTTKKLIKQFKIDAYFNIILDGSDDIKRKPDPDIYLAAARELCVSPKKCLVFEDSLVGVEAAKAAGMTVVYVGTKGSGNPADYFIADFSEILEGEND